MKPGNVKGNMAAGVDEPGKGVPVAPHRLRQVWSMDRFWFPSPIFGYAVAVAAVVLATLVREALQPALGNTAQFVTFFVAVVLAGAVGGRGPALAATALSAISVQYFFFEPRYSLWLDRPIDLTAIGSFVLAALLIAWIAGRLHQAMRTASERAAALGRQAALIDLSPGGIIVRKLDGTVTFWSRGAETLYGWTQQEALGQRTQALFQTQLPQPLDEIGQQLRQTGRWSGELIHRTKSGREITVQSWWLAQFNGRGEVAELLESNVDITERKRAEETLQESEQQFRSFFENAAVGAAQLDASGRFIQVNNRYCQITGYRREELLTMALTDLSHPEDRERDQQYLTRFLNGERSQYDIEKRYVRKDGQVIWVHVTAGAVRDPEGRLIRTTGVVEDITERKRAQEELQAAYQRTETILGSITDAFFALDHQCRFTYANAETERQLRKSAAELRGGYILDQFPGAEEFLHHYEQVLATGQADHFEAYYPPLEKWFEVHAYPSPDGLSIYFRNVNDRKRAQEALRESESFYRQMLESIPGMVFTTRPDGYCDYMSQQWADFTGVPMSEMAGNGWNTLLHSEDQGRAYEAWRAAVAEKAPYDLEYRVRRHDGEYRWFRVIGRPIRNDEGQIIRWFSVALDIEDIKRAQNSLQRFAEELERQVKARTGELKATVEELQRSNDDLEKFAYISSHDLQEPLRMVSSYMGLLEYRYKDKLDAKAKEYIDFAVEGAVRMSNLIKDLLAYSRVTSQGREPRAVSADAVLMKTLAGLQLPIEETGASITRDHLPTVQADPTQLGQVFQNLISNALKYRKDTEPPLIHVSAERRNGQWLFSVKDNGIGIEPEHFEKIFVPFKRLHADRAKYPGSGVGLAIVKRIVERHHGRVCVDSTPSQGSTFYFTMPVSNQEEADHETSRVCQIDASPSGRG